MTRRPGAARHPPDSEATAPTEGNVAPTDGDALSQAEEILNGVEVPAEESVASGAAAEAQAAELRNDLLRLQAEYVNYRKRVERDRAVAGEMAVIGVLNSLLPVLDDVDAPASTVTSKAAPPSPPSPPSWRTR